MDVEECLQEGFLKKIEVDKKLIQKELDEANYDLSRAKDALEENDFKWSIIKTYYSMFHAAKAVLFSLGLREKRHFAVGIVLERLSKKGKIQFKFINDYKGAMLSREDADYRYVHSKDTAEYLIDVAEEFIEKMKELTNKVKPNEIF
jgi:uncharacterized protein (UPF0332 family)